MNMPKMKMLLVLLFSCAFTQLIIAQENYDPNVVKGNSNLILANGEVQKGMLTYYVLNNRISFVKEFGDTEKKYKAKEIKSFTLGDSVFFAKQPKGMELGFSKDYQIVMLKTSAQGKIKLYERTIVQDEGLLGANAKLVKDLFVELPGNESEIYSTTGGKFWPNFSKKVSLIFADCPVLSKKIADKEEGYKESEGGTKLGFGMLKKAMKDSLSLKESSTPTDKPVNIWEKLINEYNSCTK